MASYPIPNPQYGIYNPNNFSRQSSSTDALTVDTGKLYFLQFPNAQTTQTEFLHSIGVASDATFNGPVVFNETVTYNSDIDFLANVTVEGTATVMDNLLCESTATVTGILTCETGIDISNSGGITFPDNTTQTTAFIEANYAQLNTDNTFLATFTQDFNGNVNLNGITNGVTQLSGNNSTLLATTAFVQDAVQVSGVQTTDSPLLWTGANTNQYNAGTGSTLTYTYPYGLSQLYNLSGGNEEFSLVANNGNAGPEDNAFRIYCIPGNQTGIQISALTPQLILSNNGTAAFIRDGINVNSGNITNIGALAGIGGNVSCFSNLLFGVGNVINMQNNNITNINTLTGNSTSNITVNSTIGMGTGKSINMNNNSIDLITSLSGGSGSTPITINSPLSMSSASNISMNNNNITSIGAGSTAYTQPNGTSGTSIATTAYVQNMFVTQTISLAANNQYYAIVPGFNSFVSSYIHLDNNQYLVTLNTMLTTSNPMLFDTNSTMPPNTVNTLTFTFNSGATVPYAPSTGTNFGKIVLQNNNTLTQQNVSLIMYNNAVILTLQNTLYLSPNTSYQLYFIKNNITVG